MKLFYKILDFYIKSSLHVALAVFAFVQVAKLSLNITNNFYLELSIFFATIIGYNFLKYYALDWKKKGTFTTNWTIILVTFLATIFFCYSYFQLKNNVQLTFIKIAFLVIFYPLLRNLWFSKLIAIAFCVTYVVTEIPLMCYTFIKEEKLFFETQLFLIIFTLMLPFEIYDSNIDSQNQKTIVQRFGVLKTKIIGFGLLTIVVLLNLLHKTNISTLVFTFIIAVFLYFSETKNSKYYTSFWVESLPIFWWILLLVFSYLF